MTPFSRREFLQASVGGAVLGASRAWADEDPSKALAPKPSMFPAKAKSIILLVTQGGMSQMDTFDPKPDLDKYHGRKLTPVVFTAGSVARPSIEVMPTIGGLKLP